MPEFRELAELFVRVGVVIAGDLTEDDALAVITAAGVEAIDAADAAAVTKSRSGQFHTVAATSELAVCVDEIQYELASGPCVAAAQADSVLRSGDLRVETRWPEFARRAVAETGVLSMLSFRMCVEPGGVFAGLNFYSTAADVFDELAEATGLVLAAHGALALTGAARLQRIANLEHALASNRDIGVAIGILMTRHLATRQQAFDLLRVASQHTHRKIADIARDVIEAGELSFPAAAYVHRTPSSSPLGAEEFGY